LAQVKRDNEITDINILFPIRNIKHVLWIVRILIR
jgi:hypothetical protein